MNTGKLENAIVCSTCGALNDGYTATSNTEERPPADGDITICAYCVTVSKYDKNVTVLTKVSEEELQDLKMKEPNIYVEITKTCAWLRMEKLDSILNSYLRGSKYFKKR